MKLYNTNNGTVIEANGNFYAVKAEWEKLINDDNAFQSAAELIKDATAGNSRLVEELLPVIGNNQELWACGVTYLRSKIGRQEESKDAGGGDFYGRVYEAERPECFFQKYTTPCSR